MRRRDFMRRSVLGLISTGISLPLINGCAEKQEQIPRQDRQYKILYRTLGRTNLRIPLISFGAMNTASPDLIKRALEMGIKHFDTAHIYLDGNSERAIGKILKETGKRNEVYVGTKLAFAADEGIFLSKSNKRGPGATEENFSRLLEKSLDRLRTDYVDILYNHGPDTLQMVSYEPLLNAFVKAKESGKIRHIGLSTHKNEPRVIRAAADSGVYDVVLTAYNYVKENRRDIKKSFKYAAEKGVGLIAMKTQGGRRLQESGEIEVNHQAALKWVFNDENVCTAIPGMTTFDQLESNFSIMSNLELSDAERGDLKLASTLKGTLYCQSCDSCKSSCSHRVKIPDLMRAFMYARGYGNSVQAKITVQELPENRSLDVCRNCTSCSAFCPNGINIKSRLSYLIEEGMYQG